jgi:hypothetical protein
MFSAPRLGPMVRSSMISIGAASEPARSSRAWSAASCVRHVAGDLQSAAADLAADGGAVTTSPLPFSNSTMAMRLPTFSRVTSRHRARPLSSSRRLTAGSWSGRRWLKRR